MTNLMKLLVVFLGLGSNGCALAVLSLKSQIVPTLVHQTILEATPATAQKIILREIFVNIGNEQFDKVEAAFNEKQGWKFATYDGDKIYADTNTAEPFAGKTAKWYIENGEAYIISCRSPINALNEIRPAEGWSQEQIDEAKNSIEVASNDLDQNCMLQDEATGVPEVLDGIKSVSSVDLSERRGQFKKEFDDKQNQILAKMDKIEHTTGPSRSLAGSSE